MKLFAYKSDYSSPDKARSRSSFDVEGMHPNPSAYRFPTGTRSHRPNMVYSIHSVEGCENTFEWTTESVSMLVRCEVRPLGLLIIDSQVYMSRVSPRGSAVVVILARKESTWPNGSVAQGLVLSRLCCFLASVMRLS